MTLHGGVAAAPVDGVVAGLAVDGGEAADGGEDFGGVVRLLAQPELTRVFGRPGRVVEDTDTVCALVEVVAKDAAEQIK